MERTEFKLSVVGLITWRGQILLVQTGYGKELFGKNAFPGGYVKKFEDPEEALEKILQHDLHLRIRVHEIVGITARQRLRGEKTQFVCTLFLHAIPVDVRGMTAKGKTHDFRWVPVAKVLNDLSDIARRWLPHQTIDFLEANTE